MLNKELSHLSESSKSGNQISEYICSTFLGKLVWLPRNRLLLLPFLLPIFLSVDMINRTKSNLLSIALSFLNDFADKQQEVDVQTFDNQPNPTPSSVGGSGTHSNRSRSPRTMSQISGFKRPLMHTNSFTSDRLPAYGVETPHEVTLGAMLNDINTWGIDIFKIGTLSCNRPLTSIAYQIFQVSSLMMSLSFH